MAELLVVARVGCRDFSSAKNEAKEKLFQLLV